MYDRPLRSCRLLCAEEEGRSVSGGEVCGEGGEGGLEGGEIIFSSRDK